MRVIVHGGMHKTGTTAFQHRIEQFAPRLLEHGVYVPPGGVTAHVAALVPLNPDWCADTMQRLVDEARDLGAHTLLMSAEAVSRLSTKDFRQTAESLRGLDPALFFTFRHWTGYLPSRWVQYSRRRDSQGFDAYVETVAQDDNNLDHRFDLVLTRAAEGLGLSPVALSYDAAEAADGMTTALLRAMDFSEPLVAELTAAEERVNVRVDWTTSELCRLLNGVAAGRRGLVQDEKSRAVAANTRCYTMFDFEWRLGALDDTLRQDLMDLILETEVRTEFDATAMFGTAARRLTDLHGALFINTDGRLPAPAPKELHYSSLTWQAFAQRAGERAEAALEQLSVGQSA